MSPKLKLYIFRFSRVILGIVFLFSGIGKIIDPEGAVQLVKMAAVQTPLLETFSYEIVMAVSIAELIVVALLISGRAMFATYTFSFFLVAAFTTVLTYFLLSDVPVSTCGCFGAFSLSGGLESTLFRNTILMLVIAAGILILADKDQQSQEP